jgi:hypothetical protein
LLLLLPFNKPSNRPRLARQSYSVRWRRAKRVVNRAKIIRRHKQENRVAMIAELL